MKVLSVSRQKTEVVREKLNRRSLLIGRSPACDIVLRNPGIKPVHYLLEWFGTNEFDPDKGQWALVDLSDVSGSKKKGQLTGEAIVLGSEKTVIQGFDFEVIEDSLAASDLKPGVIKRGLSDDTENLHFLKPQTIFEVVHYRKDVDAVVSVRHIPLASMNQPIIFESSNLLSVHLDSRGNGLEIVNDSGKGDFQVFLRGSEVTQNIAEKGQKLSIQPGDLYILSTEQNEFFLRLVHDVKVAYDDLAWLKDPMVVTFISVCLFLCMIGFWMWVSPPTQAEVVKEPPREIGRAHV